MSTHPSRRSRRSSLATTQTGIAEDLLRSVDESLRQATGDLEDDERGHLATAFIPLIRLGAELPRSPDDQVVSAVELPVRDVGMDQLRDEYECGASVRPELKIGRSNDSETVADRAFRPSKWQLRPVMNILL